MSEARAEKYAYWEKLWQLVEECRQILIVDADNVGSKQIMDIRRDLRGKATLLFGKNTLIRTGLKHRLAKPDHNDEDFAKRKDKWFPMEELKELIPLVKKNIGLIFCKGSLSDIQKVVMESRVPAEAKTGSIAPVNVTVPAGPTGMDPSQTAFFQALGIATKIVKSQIEIVTDVHIIEQGKKVGSSEAVLLKKLNIRPFTYGFKLVSVYDNGSVYSPDALRISDDEIAQKFAMGLRNVAAISIGAGYPTAAALPYAFSSGFRNLVSIAAEAGYSFKEGASLINLLQNPEALLAAQAATASVAAPAATSSAAAKPVEAAKAEEEEAADADIGGMFGDDY